jgi:acrylyl-CoA reductase (NADPH)
MAGNFTGLLLEEAGGKVSAAVKELPLDSLPPGDVTVRVTHSTLNYKDGMILKGIGRLVRKYPHVPGVDFAGVVEDSRHPAWKKGDAAVLTGWRVGEMQWGGYATKARVSGDWLVKMPQGMSAGQAMAVGTAGFTAMLAVMALEAHGLKPGAGEVLVTGAAGGVGSVATAILAKLGHQAVCSTGRPETADYLKSLGASAIVDRASLSGPPAKPLDAERWAACVDSVGGTTLATVLTQMKYRGSVAACGLAGGPKLDATVIPFLLRGVNLLGIDSVMCPMPQRLEAWSRLKRDLPPEKLDALTVPAKLADLPRLAGEILQGRVRGRVVVETGA